MFCRLAVLIVVLAAGAASGAEYEVGQRWEYEHEGPRPGGTEPNAIDGRRILQVVSQSEEDGRTFWSIEDRFTNDPNVVGVLRIDDEGKLAALDIANEKGERAVLTYETPVPYHATEMEVGEEVTLVTKLLGADGKTAMTSTIVLKRLGDEAVETPAGVFEGCECLEMAVKSYIDLKIVKVTFEEKRKRWYSEQVNGLVKEVYEKIPGKFMTWSWEGYTATSTLASFDIKEVDETATVVVDPTVGDSVVVHKQRIGTAFGLIALACILALAVGLTGVVVAVILVRRGK